MQQTSAIRQYEHSWHTAAADPSDSENKGGAQNLWCQIWEAFSSHKTKSVLPPTPNLLIVQRLDSRRKLLLLSQIFHGAACWLKAAAAACYAEVCAKESKLFEYLAVRLPCQYIVVVSRMYRSKMYKLFSQGFGAHVFTNEEFWTSQMFGREAVPLGEQRAGIHFGTVNYGAHAWGTPSLPEWANWSNLPANVLCLSNFRLVLESKKRNCSKQ